MPDCPNDEMRDALPALAGDTLDAATRARVLAHVASCASCDAERAMIEDVRRAFPVPAVDAARIVAALPRAPRVVANGGSAAPVRDAVVSLDARRAVRSARNAAQTSGGARWRRAAAIGAILLGGGVGYGVLREQPPGDAPAAPPEPRVAVSRSDSGTTGARAGGRALSLGGVVDGMSTNAMESLLADLEGLDAVPGEEPEADLPGFAGQGGA